MDMPTLKKTLIHNLSAFSIPSELGMNQLILITAAGTITGELLTTSDEENELTSVNIITQYIKKVGTTYKQDYEIPEQQELAGNDGYIILKNVTIQNGSSKTTVPVLAVFFDQIIAVTVGNLN